MSRNAACTGSWKVKLEHICQVLLTNYKASLPGTFSQAECSFKFPEKAKWTEKNLQSKAVAEQWDHFSLNTQQSLLSLTLSFLYSGSQDAHRQIARLSSLCNAWNTGTLTDVWDMVSKFKQCALLSSSWAVRKIDGLNKAVRRLPYARPISWYIIQGACVVWGSSHAHALKKFISTFQLLSCPPNNMSRGFALCAHIFYIFQPQSRVLWSISTHCSLHQRYANQIFYQSVGSLSRFSI